MISITVYKGTSDKFTLGLKAAGAFQDVSASTRMTLQVGELLVDSAMHATAFDWTSNGADGEVEFNIAGINGLERGKFTSLLTVFDATYPNGKPWDQIALTVK